MINQIAILIVLTLMISCNLVLAATTNVPGDFATIQEGIDASITGDTVIVASGIYRGDGNRDLEFGWTSV